MSCPCIVEFVNSESGDYRSAFTNLGWFPNDFDTTLRIGAALAEISTTFEWDYVLIPPCDFCMKREDFENALEFSKYIKGLVDVQRKIKLQNTFTLKKYKIPFSDYTGKLNK